MKLFIRIAWREVFVSIFFYYYFFRFVLFFFISIVLSTIVMVHFKMAKMKGIYFVSLVN